MTTQTLTFTTTPRPPRNTEATRLAKRIAMKRSRIGRSHGFVLRQLHAEVAELEFQLSTLTTSDTTEDER